jgi:hypothetical protein
MAMTHAPKMTRTGIQCAPLPSRRPTSAVMTNPPIGRMTNSGINASRLT